MRLSVRTHYALAIDFLTQCSVMSTQRVIISHNRLCANYSLACCRLAYERRHPVRLRDKGVESWIISSEHCRHGIQQPDLATVDLLDTVEQQTQ